MAEIWIHLVVVLLWRMDWTARIILERVVVRQLAVRVRPEEGLLILSKRSLSMQVLEMHECFTMLGPVSSVARHLVENSGSHTAHNHTACSYRQDVNPLRHGEPIQRTLFFARARCASANVIVPHSAVVESAVGPSRSKAVRDRFFVKWDEPAKIQRQGVR
jgi:hypothetical protein